MSLDSIDKKILLSLIKNSRMPISVMSKELHLSREVISYRMSKLESSKLITNYVARINQSLFCFGIALMTCKLIRSNVTRFNQIISFIKQNESINWCIELCGNHDLAFTILYDDSKDLSRIVSSIISFIGHNLKEHELSLYVDEYKFDRSGLISEKHEKSESYDKKTLSFYNSSKLKIDNIDLEIIKLLSSNCRLKNIDIAQKISVSEDVVRLRIKNLEKQNVILGYTISLDANKLGFEAYQMFLKIEILDDKTLNKIKYFVKTNPYIVFAVQTTGKHNLILNIHAKNRTHFSDLILEIRNNISELTDYEFQLDMQTHKEIFVPLDKIKNKI